MGSPTTHLAQLKSLVGPAEESKGIDRAVGARSWPPARRPGGITDMDADYPCIAGQPARTLAEVSLFSTEPSNADFRVLLQEV